jgi:folate-dependent phosphoribosylglycinamide formyltransferase PurN
VRVGGATVHSSPRTSITGPSSYKASVPCDDADSVTARILEVEHELYPAAIRRFAENRLEIDWRSTGGACAFAVRHPPCYRGLATVPPGVGLARNLGR